MADENNQLEIDPSAVSPRGFVPEHSELYLEHVDYYFDVQLGATLLSFSEEDKNRLYQMLTDYADLFKKAFSPKIPLVEHILGNPWPPQEIANDPEKQHLTFGTIDNCPIIADYENWKSSQSTPKVKANTSSSLPL